MRACSRAFCKGNNTRVAAQLLPALLRPPPRSRCSTKFQWLTTTAHKWRRRDYCHHSYWSLSSSSLRLPLRVLSVAVCYCHAFFHLLLDDTALLDPGLFLRLGWLPLIHSVCPCLIVRNVRKCPNQSMIEPTNIRIKSTDFDLIL